MSERIIKPMLVIAKSHLLFSSDSAAELQTIAVCMGLKILKACASFNSIIVWSFMAVSKHPIFYAKSLFSIVEEKMSGEDYMEVQKMVAELQAEVRRDMFTDKWIEDDVEKMIQQYLTVRKII